MANAGIERRVDIQIPSANERMVGWLYSSSKYSASNRGPAIVLAHGLGATKELKLDVFADKLNHMGYTAVVFDYRCNGGSSGLPRGLIDWSMQQADWHAALDYVRHLENVDPERVGLFGTSFGGGHVLQVAATDRRIKAVISQCPFTDGIQSSLCCGFKALPKLLLLGVRDGLFGTDQNPITVELVGKPGEAALMNAPDVLTGYLPLVPPEDTFIPGTEPLRRVPARIINTLPWLRPGSYAAKIQCPFLVAICARDSVAPAKATLSYARKAPQCTIKWYDDMGHFDIYIGDKHERAFKDYAEFLERNFPA